MNTISEQLLQAIDTMTDAKIEKLQFDKTIQASVYSIVNVDTGEYRVRYTGNIFSAYAREGKIYKVGEYVYVKVPEGDFSNKKIIEGRVSETTLSYSEMTGLQNTVESVSPTFDTIYGYNTSASAGLIAGAPTTEVTVFSTEEPNLLFQQYANEYETLRIAADFKTNFYSEHTKGNYGIRITFFANDDSEVSYNLDLESFNGAPYNFTVYTPQSVILKVQKGYLKGIKSIVFFQEDFDYDRFVTNGIEGELNTTIANLFVTNIAIDYVEIKDLTQESLYLQISAPQGTLLTQQVQSVDLVGKLLASGEDVLSASTCECTWYQKDLSVKAGSDAYTKAAGVGWREIEGDFNQLSLTLADVPFINEYKLIILYNETTPISATVKVINTLSEYSCSIVQYTDVDAIYLNIDGDRVYYGDWYIQYPDGAYNQIAEYQNTINVTSYLKYTTLTFYCQVYDEDNVIANLSYEITNSENENDVVVTYQGENSFKYDANGDISVDDYEVARWLKAVLSWKDGSGVSYKVEWHGPDGQTLTTTPYSPTYSMITNLRIDSDYTVWYNINRKYNINYNNNTLYLIVTTIDGQVYEFEKELLFVKDGDQGVNGTTYILAIRPCDSNCEKLSGFNPLVYNGGWIDSQRYYCYVYKDGEQINSSSGFEIEYSWTGENLTLTTPTEAMITAAGGESSPTAVHYLKATATVKDTINDTKTELYAIYPIDVLVGDLDKDKVDITSIPQFIKYSASGTNPTYENNAIQFLYDGEDYSSSITSENTDVLQVIQRDSGEYYLKPAISYYGDDEQPMGLLKCTYSGDKYVMHPVILYLDTYGNEAINGWDGTKLEIGIDEDSEEMQYIFAPQIGAGEKDSQNKFSGVVMGKLSVPDSISRWGLYGFRAGVNAFGMDVTGHAWFGLPGEKIDFNETGGATITGGDGGNEDAGMTITLQSNGDATTNAIRLGKGKFNVTYGGILTAESATIKGNITATSGKIGSWEINNGAISNGNTTLTSGGQLECTGGTIGGWTIGQNAITSQYVTLSSQNGITMNKGSINLADNFKVDANGNVTINGNLTLKSGAISWSNLSSDTQNAINSASEDVARLANGEYSGSFIGKWEIYSPTIYADEFVVYPKTNGNTTGGYSIWGYWGTQQYHFFNLRYSGVGTPTIVFSSPGGAYAYWNFDVTTISNNVQFYNSKVSFSGSSTIDFSGATVIGLPSTSTSTTTATFG